MIKEKLLGALGTFGAILWYVFELFLFVLPLVMIHQGLLLRAIFFFCMVFIPGAPTVFWVWGLVCAIGGPQDVFAIIYYVATAIIFLPYLVSFVCDAITFFVNKRMAHNNDVNKVKPRAGSPLKLAVAALSVLSAALAVSCCLMGYHLQCAQKSLSVSQRQVIEAASYLRHADSVVDDYAGRIETYIQYPSYVRRADRYDFYNTFENYQRDHRVPDPNPFPWNKAIPIEK